MRRFPWLVPSTVALGLALAFGATPGCSCDADKGQGDGGVPLDASTGGGDQGGGGGDGALNACGDNDPSCTVVCTGPTCQPPNQFPLPSDNPPPSNVGADGVTRSPMGYIVLDSTHASFDYLWIADNDAYNIGLISKLDSKPRAVAPQGAVNGTYREVARYLTVTCKSDPDSKNWGNAAIALGTTQTGTCDGTVGCCARGPAGARTPVQLIHNRPSRTAVDFNGDVWVANRAHIEAPHQQSVTKIANSPESCVDRNGNGKIDTSNDANNDGIINTDCNGDGIPDDYGTVCTTGILKEFYGLDDECVLFTTNTGTAGGVGRPLALGPSNGPDPNGASDAWAGLFDDNSTAGQQTTFFRIDGSTGLIKQSVKIQPVNNVSSRPYGAVVDSYGILWAPNIENHSLFYFDTNTPTNQGMVQPPGTTGGNGFYGVAIDGYMAAQTPGGAQQLIQQVWMAHWGATGAFRYRPKRSLSFADLGQGTWSQITFSGLSGTPSGRGVGVDNRAPTSFAWVGLDGAASIGKIPVDIPDGMQTLTAATNVFSTVGGSGTIGTGVAADLDIWAINYNSFTATHFKVDPMGVVTLPGATDQVKLDDNGLTPSQPGGATTVAHAQPYPYTYSDFTGFGLRNFTNPRGSYRWTQQGCGAGKTRWLKVIWDADTPVGTKIVMRARSADDTTSLGAATYFGDYTTSPADLSQAPGPVVPNPSGYLEVDFRLSTQDKSSTPALKSFQIIYECLNQLG